ncbi:MAG: hypothetical protein HXS54_13760 [Theionarchaea archaeon]|nr:hypothetical protein [Theionarchaea archaeon]
MNREYRLRRFFGQQDNLDAIYWLMKGYSYREVGDTIGRPHSFVQRVSNFLRVHGLAVGRQWKADLEALNMTRTFKFYDYIWDDRPEEVKKNEKFLSYFADVKSGKSSHFVIYTFPNEVNTKIGESISPYYILIPKFKAPLHECDISLDAFGEAYEQENNENPFPPRGELIEPDIIHIEIARYVELFGKPPPDRPTDEALERIDEEDLGEINLSRLVEIIKDDIKAEGLEDKVDATYDIVRNRYNDMVEKNIIYPGFGLDMRKLEYILSFCWIKKDEIYRIMKSFANFNVVTGLAYTEGDKYLLHLQFFKEKEIEILQILDSIDHENEVFKVLEVHDNITVPYEYYFEKEKEKRE